MPYPDTSKKEKKRKKKEFDLGPTLVVHTLNLSPKGVKSLEVNLVYISSSMPARDSKSDYLKMNKSIKIKMGKICTI